MEGETRVKLMLRIGKASTGKEENGDPLDGRKIGGHG